MLKYFSNGPNKQLLFQFFFTLKSGINWPNYGFRNNNEELIEILGWDLKIDYKFIEDIVMNDDGIIELHLGL